jgi:hypothetical protein
MKHLGYLDYIERHKMHDETLDWARLIMLILGTAFVVKMIWELVTQLNYQSGINPMVTEE